MKSLNLLCFLLTLIISLILPSFSRHFTLQLTHNIPNSLNPQQFISHIATSTLHRAHRIKNSPTATANTPLFPRSTGGYSINLSIGTPPQNIPTFFDTGSSLVWVPCTSQYSCSNCSRNHSKITTFKPNRSSSKKHINCHNQKCQWLDQPGNIISCPSCNRSIPSDCSRPCFYSQEYGAGDTSGKAIFENINLNAKVVKGLLVGCSIMSDQMPEGIAGFGRSPMSLPNQLNLTKFSYCLVSHKFDDALKSSSLILGNSGSLPGVAYTPLLKNPKMSPFNQYYYVQLEQITVNNIIVNVPRKQLVTDPNGNGGTVVDSGSTLTSLAPSLFGPVTNLYKAQMHPGQRNRVIIGKSSIGNLMCVDVTGEQKILFPGVVFHFKGGAKMDLPVDNYIKGGAGISCLPFVNVTFEVGATGNGPAVILGNYQQQNYHIEYDLKNERLGFKKQVC